MKTVPRFMHGNLRTMRVALEEMNTTDEVRAETGWKFLLLPLYRAPRGGLIPRPKLMSRLELSLQRGLARVVGGKSEVLPPISRVEAQKKTDIGTGHSAPSSAVQNLRRTR